MVDERPSKKRRVSANKILRTDASITRSHSDAHIAAERTSRMPEDREPLRSLDRGISPPPGTKPFGAGSTTPDEGGGSIREARPEDAHSSPRPMLSAGANALTKRFISSPISLTHIRDLPNEHNIDAVTLFDILGDPLIKEAWIFNYLHDVSFTMSHLDPDVRDIVQVKVIHGSWKREDSNRIAIEADAEQFKNVQVITAHMPEMFGTHHSKAIILIRHDDSAQVVIHTANMIRKDWTNMTQAVWRSPMLPILNHAGKSADDSPIGSGERFKTDLLNYLRAYQGRTKALVEQLKHYDFEAVRAALVASVPCKQVIDPTDTKQTRFGWSGLRHILKSIPTDKADSKETAQIVVQISSVGHLGAKEKWLDPFLKTLSVTVDSVSNRVRFQNGVAKPSLPKRPEYHIIFPTAEEVRRSLDGYSSGASIHMKLESKAMQTQLTYMRPMLRHWAGNDEDDTETGESQTATATIYPAIPQPQTVRPERVRTRRALRSRAAPHIKTYVRYSDATMTRIDWAMMTSANLSKQAWGEAAKEGSGDNGREIRIASYELGVVVWPALFADKTKSSNGESQSTGKAELPAPAVMVPVFGRDPPGVMEDEGLAVEAGADVVVGFRLPYDVPLVRYTKDEVPWCATTEHNEPDRNGLVWPGFSRRA